MNTFDEDILQDSFVTSEKKKEPYSSYTSKSSLNIKKVENDYSVFISYWEGDIDKLELLSTKIKSFSSQRSTKLNVKYFDNKDFLKKHKEAFVALLNNTKVDDAGFEEVENVFKNLLEEDKYGALKLLEEVYVTSLESAECMDNLQTGILKLLCSYSYDELRPAAQLIVSASYNIKSIRVKSAVFNVFGHWANQESLNMLKKFEEPAEAWLRMKYKALICSIEKKYAVY